VPVEAAFGSAVRGTLAPMSATVYGRAARRYAHLAVIDGGRGA
jgi:hypothetical protein